MAWCLKHLIQPSINLKQLISVFVKQLIYNHPFLRQITLMNLFKTVCTCEVVSELINNDAVMFIINTDVQVYKTSYISVLRKGNYTQVSREFSSRTTMRHYFIIMLKSHLTNLQTCYFIFIVKSAVYKNYKYSII